MRQMQRGDGRKGASAALPAYRMPDMRNWRSNRFAALLIILMIFREISFKTFQQ